MLWLFFFALSVWLRGSAAAGVYLSLRPGRIASGIDLGLAWWEKNGRRYALRELIELYVSAGGLHKLIVGEMDSHNVVRY